MSVATEVTQPPPAPAAGDHILDVDDITLRFGGVTSLSNVTMHQTRGEMLAVIGPNGAGKTSLFNSITGVYSPQEGEIRFTPSGKVPTVVSGRKVVLNNRLGIARTFQNIRLFKALTALENVKIGVESRHRTGPFSAMLHLPLNRREEREGDQEAAELLDFVGLRQRTNEVSGSLSYGDQRRLEIARALGTRPELLLLDEPAAGTNPSEKLALTELIRSINVQRGVSVLLIEHDMGLVMSLAHRIIVLNFGQIIAEGTPAEVQRNPAVVEAYLGVAEDAESVSPSVAPETAAQLAGEEEPIREPGLDPDSDPGEER